MTHALLLCRIFTRSKCTVGIISEDEYREFGAVEGPALELLRSADEVWVPGTKGNLIALPHLVRAGVRLKLGTPSHLGKDASRSPSRALRRAAKKVSELPVALGGWRDATIEDYLLAELYSRLVFGGHHGDMLQEAAGHVRVWERLRFIEGLGENAVCVLAGYLDPRWYIDPKHPRRSSRFKSYGGFGAPEKDKKQRSANELRSWDLRETIWRSVVWAVRPSKQREPGPREFLKREWLRRYDAVIERGLPHPVARHMADVKCVQKFLVFAWFIWMDIVTGQSRFDPDRYFKDQDTIEAFERHCRYACRAGEQPPSGESSSVLEGTEQEERTRVHAQSSA